MMAIFKLKTTVAANFPPDYPKYKRILANLMYSVFGIILFPRKNLLTRQDIKNIKKNVKKGDILLCGDLRTFFSVALNDPLTHVMFAISRKRAIHAIRQGVQIVKLKEIFIKYDTFLILRLPRIKGRRKIIRQAIRSAKKHLGKPYNYFLEDRDDCFFCSALVTNVLVDAGYNIQINSLDLPKPGCTDKEAHNNSLIMRPADFLKSGLNSVLLSHNLVYDGKKLSFLESKNNLDVYLRKIRQEARLLKKMASSFSK
jgi:hypothetical protein